MLQFARIRGSEEIRNIVFYGDTEASENLYNRLKEDLAGNDLEVSPLSIPPQIHGSNNLNFSVYANAIGAMFKRDKLTEHINLLETDAAQMGVAGKVQDDRSFTIVAAGGLGLAVIIIGVAFGILAATDAGYKNKTAELRADIDSPETAAKLQQYEDLQTMKGIVREYADNINNASDAYKTLPVIEPAVYEAIDTALETVKDETDKVTESPEYSIGYGDGILNVPITIETSEEFTQKYPSNLVQYLYDTYGEEAEEEENRLFSSVEYNNYSVSTTSNEQTHQVISEINFSLTLHMLPNELPEIQEETPEEEAPEEAPAE